NGNTTGDVLAFGDGIAPEDIVAFGSGDDLVIRIKDTADQITIRYDLNYSNWRIEQFTFPDGTTWSHADMQALALVSTPGHDSLISGYDGNVLDGGDGNDTLTGNGGSD
ncbi:calcium-binding protein, partial [Novosphingobium beihaiensis]